MASLVSMMDTSPLAASPSTEAGRTTAMKSPYALHQKWQLRKSDVKIQRRVEPFRMPTEVERSLRSRQQLPGTSAVRCVCHERILELGKRGCVGGGGMARYDLCTDAGAQR
jgi:hypothetical protein